MQTLDIQQLDQVSGGAIPVAVAVGYFVAGTAFGGACAAGALALAKYIKNSLN